MKRLKHALVAALMLAPQVVDAHSAKIGPNGGVQVDAGNLHVELVVNDTTMIFYLRDHDDRPVSTVGFKGTAIFVLEGKPQRIPLAPAGDNRLNGTAPAPLPAQPKGAIQLTTPSGSTAQGRFN